MPLRPGITTSSSTTSGCARPRRAIASSRVAASPTTSKSSSLSSSRREPGADERVVVADQNADRSSHAPSILAPSGRATGFAARRGADFYGAARQTGSSAMSVVPAPGDALHLEAAAEQADALAHADEAERALAHRAGSKPAPSSSITRTRRRRRRRRRRCSPSRACGVLDDVRQRLLDDPVERGLVLRRRASTGERDVELDVEPAPLGDDGRQPLERRLRGRSRRAPAGAARPSGAARRRAPSRRARGSGRAAPRPTCSSSAFSPSRIDASAWPVSSCSSRASRLRSSSCPSSSARTASRPTRSESSIARAARFANASRDPHVGVGEARVGAALVVGDDDADGAARGRSAARRARRSRRRAAARSGRPRGRRSASRSAPRAAARASGRPSSASRRAGARAVAAAFSPLAASTRSCSPSGGRQLDQHDARVEQLAQPRRPRGRRAATSSVSVDERLRDLVQRLELPRPLARRLVEARVLDRDRRLRGEQARRSPRPRR